MNLRKAVHRYIEAHRDEHIEKLREFLRRPGISAENVGIRESAQLLMRIYRDLGCQEVELVETGGHPGVWACLDVGAPKTLIVYGMYDVQPVADQPWTHDPFAADLVPQPPFPLVVVARGAYNSRGPYRLWLNALEAVLAVTGTLPVNLMFIAEGEEEIGSPHFPQVVARYWNRLARADGVFVPDAAQDAHGRVRLSLGKKGIVYLELVASGSRWGREPQRGWIHSSRKAVVDSPVWRLVHALSPLTTPDGNTIAVPGLADPVRPPSPEDEGLLQRLAETFDLAVWREEGASGRTPSCRTPLLLNINGLCAGYTGPGTMTVLLHEALGKLDIRLVPDMRSEDVVAAPQAHLDRLGYADIEVRVRAAYEWSRTRLDAAVVQALRRVYEGYGVRYEIWPMTPGAAPMYLFTQPPLSLPLAEGGLGHGGATTLPMSTWSWRAAAGSPVWWRRRKPSWIFCTLMLGWRDEMRRVWKEELLRFSGAAVRFYPNNPLALDCLIGETEAIIAFPDRATYPHLGVALIVRDREAVESPRQW